MSQQQTVLRVQTGIDAALLPVYDFLDLYTSIPIKINKSFAELQDVAKKNTDYTIGLTIPGSKKNNRFFENFYNVDTQSLYFNANSRNNCDVLLGDEPLFRGYLKLNKVSVMNSKIEYDVTLYSTVANLFGEIGNNLLKDLDFNDDEYHFNHVFQLGQVTSNFSTSNFAIDGEKPIPYIYPVVHNGYEYNSGKTVNVSGLTTNSNTTFYSSTSPINSFASLSDAYAAGVKRYHINSPQDGLYDNQLKPALNVYSLFQLIFKKYGYKIKSDFFNTPWMKSLYLYGYYSSENTKFSYKINTIEQLPPEGCSIVLFIKDKEFNVIVTKIGSGVPVYCSTDISFTIKTVHWYGDDYYSSTITAGTSGYTTSSIDKGFYSYVTSPNVPTTLNLAYLPAAAGTVVNIEDGNIVDFSQIIDINIKQIDIISSIAKKFNLVFISNPDNPNEIQIEPYDFYVGTGNVYDWTDKLSYDKGWSVEPALNYLESDLIVTDLEDADEGNKQFKERNNRIYGQQFYYGPTSFKSQEKKIETIFGPELIRKWDDEVTNNIGLPLGINYVANNDPAENGQADWFYKGVKTKPKLFFWLGAENPFLDTVGEVYPVNVYSTYSVYISNSAGNGRFQSSTLPVISHTMPMGLADKDKITNDTLSILFNSEQVTNIEGTIQTYNTYTENDAFSKFYNNRITNIYNPNTRFLTGYFNLKYSDVKNLKPNDVIKIQEQFFTWNKISEFNLTQRELTKIELIQLNVNPQVYPERYFQYFYCDDPSKIYKFKVDFTNPNLLETNYGWSVYYDHQVGSIPGQTSGFTSTFADIDSTGYIVYVPYTMYEVDGGTYDSTGLPWEFDSMHNYIYDNGNAFSQFSMPTYWVNSGATQTGVNVFRDCAYFQATKTSSGILEGSSTNHGVIEVPRQINISWNGSLNIPLYSLDSGSTFNQSTAALTPTPFLQKITSSSNGQYVYIAGQAYLRPDRTIGQVQNLKSSDYGVTFNYAGGIGGNFLDISTDYTGKYVLAVGNPGSSPADGKICRIIKSTDYLASSTNETLGGLITTNGINNPESCAVSPTGKYQAIFGNLYNSTPGFKAISTDSGTTFNVVTGTTYVFYQSAISNDGKYIIGIDYGNGAYLSTDTGTTFNLITPTIAGRDVAMSTTGQYMYVSSPNSGVWRSTDYGVTWSFTTIPGGGEIFGVTTTNGGKSVLAKNDNNVYASDNYGRTFRRLNTVGGQWITAVQ